MKIQVAGKPAAPRKRSAHLSRILTPRDLDQAMARVKPEDRDHFLATVTPTLPFKPQPFHYCPTCKLFTSDEGIWARHTHEDPFAQNKATA